MKISVVVVVYNGARTLSDCLSSLLNLDFPNEDLEIAVVDNNSTDATKEIIKRFPVTYLFEHKRSRGAARNRGVRGTTGDYIAFTDSDCVVDRQWLTHLMRGFTNDNVAGCGGKLIQPEPRTFIDKYYRANMIFFQRKNFNRAIHPFPLVATANAVFRRSSVMAVGAFDDKFTMNEDTDLSWKLSLAGYQFNYCDDAVVYHAPPNTFVEFMRNNFEDGFGFRYLLSKYRNYYQKDPIIGFVYLCIFLTMPKMLIRFSFSIFDTKLSFAEKMALLLNIARTGGLCFSFIYASLTMMSGGGGGGKAFSPLPRAGDRPLVSLVNDKLSVKYALAASYYVANKTGTKILSLLREGKNTNDIIEGIACACHCDKTMIEKDVLAFIDDVKKEGLYGVFAHE